MRDILADLLEEQEEAVQRETVLPEEEESAAGGYLPPLVEKSVGRSAAETQTDFSVERGKDGRETVAPVENPKEGEQDRSETQREPLSQFHSIENSRQFDLGTEWEGRISAMTELLPTGRGQAQGDEEASVSASAQGVVESWAERVLHVLPGVTAALSVKKSDSVPEGVALNRAPVPTVEPSGENASPAETGIDGVSVQEKGSGVQENRRTWSSGTLYSTLRRWESAASWPESAGRSAPVPLSAAVSQSGGTGGLTLEQLDRAAQRDARRFDAPFPLY